MVQLMLDRVKDAAVFVPVATNEGLQDETVNKTTMLGIT